MVGGKLVNIIIMGGKLVILAKMGGKLVNCRIFIYFILLYSITLSLRYNNNNCHEDGRRDIIRYVNVRLKAPPIGSVANMALF